MTTAVSNTVEFTVSPASTAPAWFTAMTDKTWTTIAGSAGQRISDVLPSPLPAGSPAAICTAWNGFAVDQVDGRFISPANGGHSDYGGNEVYSLNVRAATPAWTRRTNPGGSPPSVHNYNTPVCDLSGNVWLGLLQGTYPTGAYATTPYKFNLSSNTWSAYSTSAQATGGADLERSSFAYDPTGNKVWGVTHYGDVTFAGGGTAGVWTINCSTGAGSPVISCGSGTRTGVSLAFTAGIRILFWYNDNNTVRVLNLDSPTTLYSPSLSGTIPSAGHHFGCVYHAASRAFFYWNGQGASFTKVVIPASPTTGTYVVSTVSPAPSNAITPPAPTNGAFSKFNIVNDMGNGQSALLIITAYNGPVYVYKLPVAGV